MWGEKYDTLVMLVTAAQKSMMSNLTCSTAGVSRYSPKPVLPPTGKQESCTYFAGKLLANGLHGKLGIETWLLKQ